MKIVGNRLYQLTKLSMTASDLTIISRHRLIFLKQSEKQSLLVISISVIEVPLNRSMHFTINLLVKDSEIEDPLGWVYKRIQELQ